MRPRGGGGPIDMLIVAGHLLVAASDRDRYVADCAAAVTAARAADGCLDFAVSADAVDPRRVNVFERWESRAQLEAFRGDGPDDGLLGRIAAAEVAEYAVE
jgi:heme-degrading monooxygenase HmoA